MGISVDQEEVMLLVLKMTRPEGLRNPPPLPRLLVELGREQWWLFRMRIYLYWQKVRTRKMEERQQHHLYPLQPEVHSFFDRHKAGTEQRLWTDLARLAQFFEQQTRQKLIQKCREGLNWRLWCRGTTKKLRTPLTLFNAVAFKLNDDGTGCFQ